MFIIFPRLLKNQLATSECGQIVLTLASIRLINIRCVTLLCGSCCPRLPFIFAHSFILSSSPLSLSLSQSMSLFLSHYFFSDSPLQMNRILDGISNGEKNGCVKSQDPCGWGGQAMRKLGTVALEQRKLTTGRKKREWCKKRNIKEEKDGFNKGNDDRSKLQKKNRLYDVGVGPRSTASCSHQKNTKRQ